MILISPRMSPRNWVVAVDGREHSHQAVNLCLMLRNPQDTITFVHVKDGDSYPNTKYSVPGSEYTEIDNAGRTVWDTILAYIKEKHVDFLCMGVRSQKTQSDTVGKNTLGLVKQGTTNFLIAKADKN